MNSKDSTNEITTSAKTTYHRKRKRRKWKSSSLADSHNSTDSFRNQGNCEMIPTWYWSNYFKAVEWQNKHKLALWKSYAIGLQQENRNLMLQLQKQFPGRVFNTPLTVKTFDQENKMKCRRHNRKVYDVEMESVKSPDDGIEFEMSDEMMKFFEQSIRHKLEMKKLKEEECDRIDEEVKELQEAHHEREREMKLLYGDDSSMIIGMETAIQLSFDKYCDLKSPKYWPNIPLNI